MDEALITSSPGIITVLAAVCSFFFFLEKKTKWPLFNYIPPLLFIYMVPVVLSNTHVIPTSSPVYDFMGSSMLPVFLVLMLLKVDILKTVRIMGNGILVMLLGTLGVVIGAPVAYLVVHHGLSPEAWKGFGALAGSWIGGTGNMLAVGQMVDLNESSLEFGYAVIADNAVYLIWLPIMLGSKNFAARFHSFTGVSDSRLERIEQAAQSLLVKRKRVEMRHVLYLIFLGFLVTTISVALADALPPVATDDGQVIISKNTYKILFVTLFGIVLSFTPANAIPGSQSMAMALIYLFVARMGAKADLSNLDMSVLWFLLGAYIWIFIHGAFLLGAAKLFRVDVHTAAIASAANIGGAASAPIVAAYHKPSLVPVSVLMALIGYAIGNPAAYAAALLCRWIV